MKLKHIIPALAAVTFMALSCVKEKNEEKSTPVLEVDRTSVEVSREATSSSITIKSNRQWSIKTTGNIDWLTIDPVSGGEDGDEVKSSNVSLSITANEIMEKRSCVFYIESKDPELDLVKVSIEQNAGIAMLDVKTAKTVDDIPAEGLQVDIEICSNTAWTVAVKEGATAEVTPDKTSGSGNGTVRVGVAENKLPETKTATVVISAEGCDAVEVVLNQKKADIVPEFKVEIPEKTGYADPGVFSSLGGSRWFAVKSNVPWTAKTGSGNTASDVQILTASGDGNLEKFEIRTGANKDFENRKKVELVFTPAGADPVTVELEQEKGSIMALEFRNQENNEGMWPFAEAPITSSGDTGPGKYSIGGYEILYHASADCMLESQYGWRIGKGVGNWIQSPAIQGYKLSKVTMADYNANASFTPHNIISAEDVPVVVKGGASDEYSGTFARNELVTWTLAGTKANTAYRLATTADKTMRLMHVVFEYADSSAPDPNYLSAEPASTEEVPYAGGSVNIGITSNADWTAKVKDGSTASASVNPASGHGDGTVTVTLGANGDNESKSATIVFSAAGCKDVEIQIKQAKAPAVASIEASIPEKQSGWYVDPAVFSSVGSKEGSANADNGKRAIILSAKKAWTARVGSATTASGVRLSATSGNAGESTVYVSVGANNDFSSSKKIIVEFLAEGEDPVAVEFTQEAASVLTLEFRAFDNSVRSWPFEEDPFAETGHSGSGSYTLTAGYKVGFNAANDNLVEDAQYLCWRIGTGTDCYIEAPAIPGHKLVKVSLSDYNSNTNPNICNAEVTILAGGKFADLTGSYSRGNVATWTLTDSSVGTAYRIVPTAKKTMRITYLQFVYE